MPRSNGQPTTSAPVRAAGVVMVWRAEAGYGFIREHDSQLKVYVHCSAVTDDPTMFRDLAVGQEIEYERIETERGWRAARVISSPAALQADRAVR